MEQLSLSQTFQESVFQKIEASLGSVLRSNGINASCLSMRQRKKYDSVLFGENSVIVRIITSPTMGISFPRTYVDLLEQNGLIFKRDRSAYIKFTLSSADEIYQFIPALKAITQAIIDRVPNEFDCCSRYQECSDMKKCTHPDQEFSLKCGYRKVLKSGKIFFGKNRNID